MNVRLLFGVMICSCAATAAAQTTLSSPEGFRPEIGMGFDSATSAFRSTCITMPPKSVSAAEVPDGQRTVLTMNLVESLSQSGKEFQMGAATSFRAGAWSGDARATYLSQSSFESYQLYFVIHVKVLNAQEQLAAPYKLGRRYDATFRGECGDSFVVSRRTGGEFLAVLEYRATSALDYKQMAANLRLSVGTFTGPGGALSVGARQRLQGLNRDKYVKALIVRSGTRDPLPSITVEAATKYALEFPEKVSKDAAAYSMEFSVLPYSTLTPPPRADPANDERGMVVASVAEQWLQAWDRLNGVNRILRNKSQYAFDNRGEELKAYKDAGEHLARLIEEFTAIASACRDLTKKCTASSTVVSWPEVEMPDILDEVGGCSKWTPDDKYCKVCSWRVGQTISERLSEGNSSPKLTCPSMKKGRVKVSALLQGSRPNYFKLNYRLSLHTGAGQCPGPEQKPACTFLGELPDNSSSPGVGDHEFNLTLNLDARLESDDELDSWITLDTCTDGANGKICTFYGKTLVTVTK